MGPGGRRLRSVPRASPGGALGPQGGGAAAWPTVQRTWSGARARKAPATEQRPTSGVRPTERHRSQNEKASTGGRDVQPACLLDGAGLQCAQGTCTPRLKPHNPVTDGLNVNRCLQADRRRGRKIPSLPEHQGDTGQTTGRGHLTPARCLQREDRRDLWGPSGQEPAPAWQGRGLPCPVRELTPPAAEPLSPTQRGIRAPSTKDPAGCDETLRAAPKPCCSQAHKSALF